MEAKNHADGLIHSTEKNLKEYGDKVPAADKAAIEAALQAARDAVKSDDAEDIKAKTDALMQVSMKLGEAMYKAAQSETPEAGTGHEETSGSDQAKTADDEHIVDADFEEVDNKKKK